MLYICSISLHCVTEEITLLNRTLADSAVQDTTKSYFA